MTLVSQAELKHYVEPLLCSAVEDPLQVFVAATFSQLCEPGDKTLALFGNVISSQALLESLVSREDVKASVSRIGANGVAWLEDQFGQHFPDIWNEVGQRWLPRVSKSEVLAALDQAKTLKAHLVTPESQFYPQGLNQLAEAMPAILWVLGDPAILSNPNQVSIVGSRNTNVYGRNAATDLAVVAADNQIVTVSGGAFGIDAIVHQATMAAGGITVAAMAGGIARLYPAANRELLERVAKTGVVFSEVAPNVAPAKWRFLMRNRLIAAMGKATIVVQAGLKSGSINTATTAVDLGRRVAVVPGPMNSVYSAGCHNFLNKHLGLVELVADPQGLPALLKDPLEVADTLSSAGLGVLETRALDAFVAGENQLNQVLKESGLTAKEGYLALGSLELLGMVERFGSGYRKVAK